MKKSSQITSHTDIFWFTFTMQILRYLKSRLHISQLYNSQNVVKILFCKFVKEYNENNKLPNFMFYLYREVDNV